MHIIGDSLIQNIKFENVSCFPAMKLREYVETPLYIEDEMLVYCFGINDLHSGQNIDDLLPIYNNLYRGKKITCLIIPPLQKNNIIKTFANSKLLNDDFILVEWFENYMTDDGLHPNSKTLNILMNTLYQIETNYI